MTRLLSKKQAVFLKTKKARSDVALATLFALRKNKKISSEEMETLLPPVRAGRVFYAKKLKSLIR